MTPQRALAWGECLLQGSCPRRRTRRLLLRTPLHPGAWRWLSCFAAAFFFLLLSPLLNVNAASPNPVVVALAPVQRDSPVALVALTLDADVSEVNGHTLVSGNSTFKLQNTDRMNDLQVPVGFPGWAGDPYTFDPAALSNFAVSVEGKKVTLTPSKAELKIGSGVRAVDWYTFTLSIAADEKKTVRVDFQQDLGEGALPRFTYGLLTAGGWKGSVGSARVSVSLRENTTLEQFASYEPAGAAFDGASLTWLFLSHEPPGNPTLVFMRPSFWDEFISRRRAVQQNPNDANVHASLGSLLRQLSLADSSRRENYQNQAIAEFESAARLEPNLRTVRQGLAALYEARAGPATGPRQTAFVQLAVTQWETLAAGDAAARKQLAEDYFYLGLDAQTRGAFADAKGYFDKAQAMAPNGAGPLFTSERAAAQRRALAVEWARALLESDDYAGALSTARPALDDAFISSFQPPPFLISRASVVMSPSSRNMSFQVTPFGVSQTSLRKDLDAVAAALRDSGAEVTVSQDKTDWLLSIVTPFDQTADLHAKLAALSKELPNRPEWAIAHAIVSPDELVWESSGAWLLGSTSYKEKTDLSYACGVLGGPVQTIGQALKPLESASANDGEAQLKRALLSQAREGWQRALSLGRVTYSAGADSASVEPCTAREISISASPWRFDLIAGGAVCFWLIGMVVLFAVWRLRAPKRSRLQS